MLRQILNMTAFLSYCFATPLLLYTPLIQYVRSTSNDINSTKCNPGTIVKLVGGSDTLKLISVTKDVSLSPLSSQIKSTDIFKESCINKGLMGNFDAIGIFCVQLKFSKFK